MRHGNSGNLNFSLPLLPLSLGFGFHGFLRSLRVFQCGSGEGLDLFPKRLHPCLLPPLPLQQKDFAFGKSKLHSGIPITWTLGGRQGQTGGLFACTHGRPPPSILFLLWLKPPRQGRGQGLPTTCTLHRRKTKQEQNSGGRLGAWCACPTYLCAMPPRLAFKHLSSSMKHFFFYLQHMLHFEHQWEEEFPFSIV